jgi:hypothetical protein
MVQLTLFCLKPPYAFPAGSMSSNTPDCVINSVEISRMRSAILAGDFSSMNIVSTRTNLSGDVSERLCATNVMQGYRVRNHHLPAWG